MPLVPVGTPPVGTTPPTSEPPTGGPPPGGPPPVGEPPIGLSDVGSLNLVSSYVGSGLGASVGMLRSMGNIRLISETTNAMKAVKVSTGSESTTSFGTGIGDKVKGAGLIAKGVGSSALTGAKYGGLIGGAVSALTNGYQVLTGQKSGDDAIGTVAADTVSATASGLAGGAVGGLTAMALSQFAGVSGLALTVPAVGLGLAGAIGAHYLLQSTGIYDKIKDGVKGLLGSSN